MVPLDNYQEVVSYNIVFSSDEQLHWNSTLLYGGKLRWWETLVNSLQKVTGRIKFGEFAM